MRCRVRRGPRLASSCTAWNGGCLAFRCEALHGKVGKRIHIQTRCSVRNNADLSARVSGVLSAEYIRTSKEVADIGMRKEKACRRRAEGMSGAGRKVRIAVNGKEKPHCTPPSSYAAVAYATVDVVRPRTSPCPHLKMSFRRKHEENRRLRLLHKYLLPHRRLSHINLT